MPQDFKKAMGELTAIYKNNCIEFKKYVDKNINHVGDFQPAVEKKQAKNKKRK
jgi:hypothetical protein